MPDPNQFPNPKSGLQAVSHRFQVTAGPFDLGTWSKLSGLQVTFDLAEHRIGGADTYYKYAGIPKFEKLKLSRAADQAATKLVWGWIDAVHQTGGQPSTGNVSVLNSAGGAVMDWTLQEMFPMQWNVSDFDASAGKVVIETLTIVYSGFLTPVGNGRGTPK